MLSHSAIEERLSCNSLEAKWSALSDPVQWEGKTWFQESCIMCTVTEPDSC